MGKSAGILLFWNLFSQVVSFLKTLVVASIYGVSLPLDAFNLSLAMPAVICGVFSALMQAGFVPLYMKLRGAEDFENANDVCGRYYWNIVLVLLALAICVFLTKDYCAIFWTGDGGRDLTSAVSSVIALVVLTTVLNSSVDFFSIVLNCHGRFGFASFAPAINGVISAVFIYFSPDGSLITLVYSVFVGWFVQLIVVIYAMNMSGIKVPIRIGGGKSDHFLGSLTVLAAVLPAAFFSNATNSVIQYYLAKLETGELSVFGYALRFHSAVSQVFVIGLGTIVLPYVVKLVTTGEMGKLNKWVHGVLVYGLLVSAMVSTLVYFLGGMLVELLLVRGGFSKLDALAVSDIWLLLTLSIYPVAVVTFIAKVFIALDRAKYLSFISTFVFFLTWGLCEFSYKSFGSSSIALSIGFSQFVALVFALGCYFVFAKAKRGFVMLVPELLLACCYIFSIFWITRLFVAEVFIGNVLPDLFFGSLFIVAIYFMYIPIKQIVVRKAVKGVCFR